MVAETAILLHTYWPQISPSSKPDIEHCQESERLFFQEDVAL